MSYTYSIAKWISSGRPKRSDDEVHRLFAICNTCPKFLYLSDNSGNCGSCGCRLSLGSSAMANKIRMATEDCPEGNWNQSDHAD